MTTMTGRTTWMALHRTKVHAADGIPYFQKRNSFIDYNGSKFARKRVSTTFGNIKYSNRIFAFLFVANYESFS